MYTVKIIDRCPATKVIIGKLPAIYQKGVGNHYRVQTNFERNQRGIMGIQKKESCKLSIVVFPCMIIGDNNCDIIKYIINHITACSLTVPMPSPIQLKFSV